LLSVNRYPLHVIRYREVKNPIHKEHKEDTELPRVILGLRYSA